ncbi:hypothetical protein F5X96DRAFT_267151 [Biscogniauxia mediterranea]|nr:hypothetical protein F5X96DRAFT_267151 [Biscogniauxia mediterranea]
MLVPICILLFAGLPVFAKENYAPVFAAGHKRQLMTCEQTYGAGSMQCGGMDSRFCFNPNLGQVGSQARFSCAADNINLQIDMLRTG